MSDGPGEELLVFARRLGLRDEWLQHPGTPREHFDLPPDAREEAIALGAQPVSPQELVRRCVRPKRGGTWDFRLPSDLVEASQESS
jgi:hypothetical protein